MTDPHRFQKLPEAPSPDDVILVHDVDPAHDAGDGPWHDIEWMLKNAAG